MAVSNEISGVQEQNIECASVQFDLSVHFKCAHIRFCNFICIKFHKKGGNCCEKYANSKAFLSRIPAETVWAKNLIAH